MDIINSIEKNICCFKKIILKNKIIKFIDKLIDHLINSITCITHNNNTQIFLIIIMFFITLLIQLFRALNPPMTNKRGGTADNVQFVGSNSGLTLNDEFLDIGRDLHIGGDLIINLILNQK